nr:hypothetical protein [Tanacetum cinerariifolium]
MPTRLNIKIATQNQYNQRKTLTFYGASDGGGGGWDDGGQRLDKGCQRLGWWSPTDGMVVALEMSPADGMVVGLTIMIQSLHGEILGNPSTRLSYKRRPLTYQKDPYTTTFPKILTMSGPAKLNLTPPTPVVRNIVEREKGQTSKNLDRLASDAALREYCDTHFHQLLPIRAEKVYNEKVQQEKLKEVKARLNFEGCSGRNSKIQETPQYSESRTSNKRGDLRRRLKPRRSRSMSRSPEPTGVFSSIRRDRSASPRRRHVKGAPKCMRISEFMHEITNPELIKRLDDNILKSVDEMMRVTTTFLRGGGSLQSSTKESTSNMEAAGRDEDGTEGPMIIEAEIGGHFIHRIYVDGGSTSEILYEHCFNRLRLEVKSQMIPATAPLIGFSGEIIWPMGQILLPRHRGDIQNPEGNKHEAKPKEMHLRNRGRYVPGIQGEYQRDNGMSGQEAEAAFKEMTKLIAELLTLTAPIEREELIVYLAAVQDAESAVLMKKREAKQMSIYFVSHALQGLEIKYTTDQEHHSMDKSWRISYWNVKDDPLDTPMEEEEELSDPWTLFKDGSSWVDGSGAGLILTNLKGAKFTYALRFRFDATNNEAEYEALIAGLRIAEQMGVKNLQT